MNKETIESVISNARERLVKTYDPVAIYIFGSYAWGSPEEDSDLDILVITKTAPKDRYGELVKGYTALIGLGVYKDLLILSKEEFEKESNDITSLHYKIKHKGKQIYAKA